MALSIGDILDDRYVLLQRLGEGGQGEVWKALDRIPPNREVALKLIDLERATPAGLERLRREASVLHQLSHPSLVPCRRAFEELSRKLFGLVLDFVKGSSVDDALRDERFTAENRRWALTHLASVLGYLHGRELVHRDLKPENVLLDAGFWDAPDKPEHVRLIDLGIAAVEGNPKPMTDVGMVIGTAPFLAPEVIDPATFRAPIGGPARDVFAFGVMGWMLLAGKHPSGVAEGDLRAYGMAYRAALAGAAPWPQGDVPAGWGALLKSCFALHANERPASGRDVATAIQRLRESTARTSLQEPLAEATFATRAAEEIAASEPKGTSLQTPAIEAVAAIGPKGTSLQTPAIEAVAATGPKGTSLQSPAIEAVTASGPKGTSLQAPVPEAVAGAAAIPPPPAKDADKKPSVVTYALGGAVLVLLGALVGPRIFGGSAAASGVSTTTTTPPPVALTEDSNASTTADTSRASSESTSAAIPETSSSSSTSSASTSSSSTSLTTASTSSAKSGPKTPADTAFGAACCADTTCNVSDKTLAQLHRWDSWGSGGMCKCPVMTGAQLPGCCDGRPPAKAMWSLRLSNIIETDPETKDAKNILTRYPHSSACVKRSVDPDTAYKCTPLSETARIAPAGVILGVQATTEELERTGIDIVVYRTNEHSFPLVKREAAISKDPIGLGTLCLGIVYRGLTSPEDAPVKDVSAAFFLDPVR
ncbi:MAG: serine/threonine-protein kinase [Polyangiaceae bacterium]